MIQSYFAYIFGKIQEVVLKADHLTALEAALKEEEEEIKRMREKFDDAMTALTSLPISSAEQIAALTADRDKTRPIVERIINCWMREVNAEAMLYGPDHPKWPEYKKKLEDRHEYTKMLAEAMEHFISNEVDDLIAESVRQNGQIAALTAEIERLREALA